jgi:hypothetical protein
MSHFWSCLHLARNVKRSNKKGSSFRQIRKEGIKRNIKRERERERENSRKEIREEKHKNEK